MNEKIIFRYNSKSLSKINTVRVYKGEKNVDAFEFLIPPTYNDINIINCDIKLTYITPDNNEHYLLINDFIQEDTYKDYLRFVIDIDKNFTTLTGEIQMYLTFLKADLSDDSKNIVLKSSSATVYIDEHPSGNNGITEEQLNIIDEVLLRSNKAMEIAQSVRDDADAGKFKGDAYILTDSDKEEIAQSVDLSEYATKEELKKKQDVLTETDKKEIVTSRIMDNEAPEGDRLWSSKQIDKVLQGKASIEDLNTVKSIALRASKATSYSFIENVVGDLNNSKRDNYQIGDQLYLMQENVPDLWITCVGQKAVKYNYSTDEQFLTDLEASPNTGLNIGYFFIAPMESKQINLENYYTKEQTYSRDEIQTMIDTAVNQDSLYSEVIGKEISDDGNS